MRTALLILVVFTVIRPPAKLFADTNSAIEVYRSGDYKTAIPLLQSESAQDKDNPIVRSALLSALVYDGRVDAASELSDQLATAFQSRQRPSQRVPIPVLHG